MANRFLCALFATIDILFLHSDPSLLLITNENMDMVKQISNATTMHGICDQWDLAEVSDSEVSLFNVV